MTDKATEELLGKLHGVLAQAFIDKIESNEASAGDLSAAAKFLKDNHIEVDVTEKAVLEGFKLVDLPDYEEYVA